MNVSDIMQTKIDHVSANDTVEEVSRIIFGRNINGLPVCDKDMKIIGFITERDILSHFFPNIAEYTEDKVRSMDFEEMEKKIDEIMKLPVSRIMSVTPTVITTDTPVLKALSLMFTNKIGRIPVIDGKDRFLGMVTKGDIFKFLVGKSLSIEEEESFYDWFARHYDILIDWERRLSYEIPDLVELFKKEEVKKIIDVGYSTGEHTIALAKAGFNLYGLETSTLMNKISQHKLEKLEKDVSKRISLLRGFYGDTIPKLPKNIDAAIFMGDALPFVNYTDSNILDEIAQVLKKGKGLLVFQILNMDKILQVKGGLREFAVRKSNIEYEEDCLYCTFYTYGKGGNLIYNLAVFDFLDDKLVFRGINNTPVLNIGEKEIVKKLKQLKFSDIQIYGAHMYGPLFKEHFNPLQSDWMVVVAKR